MSDFNQHQWLEIAEKMSSDVMAKGHRAAGRMATI